MDREGMILAGQDYFAKYQTEGGNGWETMADFAITIRDEALAARDAEITAALKKAEATKYAAIQITDDQQRWFKAGLKSAIASVKRHLQGEK